jgi:hypothetical protein
VPDAGWVNAKQHRLYLLDARKRRVAFRPLDPNGLVSEALHRDAQSIQETDVKRVPFPGQPSREFHRNFGETSALALVVTEQRRIEHIDGNDIECRTI